jgi:hypothetical protein
MYIAIGTAYRLRIRGSRHCAGPWDCPAPVLKGIFMRALITAILLTGALALASADIVFGNGKIETDRRSLPAFKSISIAGSGTLRVHRGGQRVEIAADSNILPYITTAVSGDELKIGFKPFTSITSATKLQFDITLPELSGVSISGSGDAYVDAFKGANFAGMVSGSGGIKADLDYSAVSLSCSGSGGFDATVKAQRLDLRCTGSGDAFLKGSADKAEVAISGSGALGARSFAVADARIIISGSGKAEIKATKSLDATVSGSGDIRYWGNPSVTQRTNGSGRISKAGD